MAATPSNDNRFDEDEEMTIYKKDATSVVFFKIVYSKDDLTLNKPGYFFKPDMAHQIFGERESIFGYRSLSIHLFYLHNTSNCYVDVQKSGQMETNEFYQPDDIMKSLSPWLPENFTTERENFLTMIEKETHQLMFGTVISEFKDKQKCTLFPDHNVYANYKITTCDLKDENFKKYHSKFETLIVWFIDGANTISLEDEKWMIFYVYEELEHPQTKKIYRTPVGFCSAYGFYMFPEGVRARISQIFVLPSHQRRGIGKKLYEVIFEHLNGMPEVKDITVEEPTATFQKIRDCSDFSLIYKELKDSNIEINTSNQMKILEYMKMHKISKKQSRRLYDILRCYVASKSGARKYNEYLNSIKLRLTKSVERDLQGGKRMCNVDRTGIATTDPIDRDAYIEAEYKRYIDDIEPSIKVLKSYIPAEN